jgi:hypothetical protein|tara:strand:+ start:913 stop:1827 length:915 start_codon:yes stop_codon:yes gene_type:complete
MIKLKQLLTEDWLDDNKWYPAHTRKTLDNIKYGDKIALYPKLHEKMFGKIPISSFHVTNPDHIKTIGKIIGKKKSISTFTRANNDSPLAKGRGIQTGTGGVIFYVRGNLLAKRYMDFDTVPDKTGRRWIESHYITGDRMIFKNAMKRAGFFKKLETMENKIRRIDAVFHDLWMTDDEIEYDEYKKLTVKEAGPYISKFIKEWFDWQNKWLVKNKSKIKKNLINPEDKPSAWWNEILIYNPKIIDVFVMERITRDGYWMQQWGDNKPGPWQKEILKYVPKNKITIGTPAKFRKWYKDREGIIDQV